MKKTNNTTNHNDNSNFYIAVPTDFNDNLIEFNGKTFTKCYAKCGEAIKQSVDVRLGQEGKNAGGMCCIFKFFAPTLLIDENKKTGFDHDLFGHEKIEFIYEETIWKYCPAYPKKVKRTVKYGKEFMDISPIINYWLKNMSKDDPANAMITHINAASRQSEKNLGILYLLQYLFENNFPKVVDDYIAKKNGKVNNLKSVELFSHQHKILGWLKNRIINGARNIISQLPPRFGKTLTFLSLFLASATRKLMIVSAYTGNVGASYFKEIRRYADFAKIQMIYANQDLSDWTYNGGKAIILFPTTGDKDRTIQNRINLINNLKKKMKITANEIFVLNEEADYGNHTNGSDEKFKMLMNTIDKKNESLVISTTGTDAWKATKLSAFGEPDAMVIANHNDWNQLIDGQEIIEE